MRTSFTYMDAYVVAARTSQVPIGVVRRDGHFWRFLVFAAAEQSQEVFKTREDAATALARAVKADFE